MHEIHQLCLLWPDLFAFEQHLQRIAGGHQARHTLTAACAGKQPDLDFGQADTRRVVIGHHAVMAGQRQFKTATQTQAIDRHGKGFAAGLQLAVDLRKTPHLVEKLLHRRGFAHGYASLCIGLRHILQHGKISPAGEGLLARGDNTTFDGGLCHHMVDHSVQLVHDLRGNNIHRAA